MSTSLMSSTKKLIIITVVLLAGIAGFILSSSLYTKNDKINFESLLLYPESKSFSGFTLTDKNHSSISNEYFKNKWTLLFFGYTNCPDVCPTTLSELQKAFKETDQNNLKSIPEVLFVSVDSQRDTSESLKTYIGFFNKKFNAATADNANILSITSQIGAAYHIGKKTNANYDVDHTAAIFLINPDAQLFGIFRTPHEASKIAADLTALIGVNE